MKIFLKISAVAGLIIFIFFCRPYTLSAQNSSGHVDVNVNVTNESSCNGNNICEANLGENENNCPDDCGCNSNGICESARGEDVNNCPADCPNPLMPPTSGYSNLSEFGLYIKNTNVSEITFDSAKIFWQTNRSSLCTFKWGTTSGYEKETVSEADNYSINHFVNINGLESSTIYHFSISCLDENNLKADSGDQYFSSLTAIKNVINFTASSQDKQILLNWTNPEIKNFKSVRILKSENFFPMNANSGNIIYEGAGSSFTDKNLVNGKIYYYAIFVFDTNNNHSSGAIALAIPQSKENSPINAAPVTPVSPVAPTAGAGKLNISDFNFYSGGQKVSLKNGKTIEAKNNQEVIISVDSGKISNACKSLILQLQNKQGSNSYWLEQDEQKTLYNVSFSAPQDQGSYQLKINCLDINNKIIKTINGELSVFSTKNINWEYWSALFISIWTIIILLLIILMRRRKKVFAFIKR